ncbi:hypothetical protein QOT17_020763 [Balamuthia mandrillaris]
MCRGVVCLLLVVALVAPSFSVRVVLYGALYREAYETFLTGTAGLEYQGFIAEGDCAQLLNTTAEVVLYPGEDYSNTCPTAFEILRELSLRGVHVVFTEWLVFQHSDELADMSPVVYDWAFVEVFLQPFISYEGHPLLDGLPDGWVFYGGTSKVTAQEDAVVIAFVQWDGNPSTEVPILSCRANNQSDSIWVHINHDFLYQTVDEELNDVQKKVLENAIRFVAEGECTPQENASDSSASSLDDSSSSSASSSSSSSSSSDGSSHASSASTLHTFWI